VDHAARAVGARVHVDVDDGARAEALLVAELGLDDDLVLLEGGPSGR
jgi:hypothetical protein